MTTTPNALAERTPLPFSPEKSQNELLIRTGLKLADGRPSEEYNESKAMFMRGSNLLSPDGQEKVMTEAEFVAFATQHFKLDAQMASSAFRACDVDGSGRLNAHEFALMRRALVTFSSERDSNISELAEMRCRTLFFRFTGPLKSTLGPIGRQQLVAHLASRPSSVADTLASLQWPENGDMSFEQFKEAAFSGSLGQARLRTRDALLSDDSGSNDYNGSSLGTSSHSKPNVVLDPRAVTNSSAPLAVMGHSAAPPSSSQLLSPPGSGGSLAKRPSGGSSIGLIKPPGPMSRQISVPAGVPDAMNEALVLDEGLRTQADWRGAAASARGSLEHATAQGVVDAAQRLATSCLGAPDVDDGTWRPAGSKDCALAELLGTASAHEQSQQLLCLAAETKRLLQTQPTVVRVGAPAKVFGDIHGQLRDLLLLFAHHGFPSHRGGDVESVSYVFNGDFVDRGAHQLEVIAVLFALKCLYPSRIWLLRGNHEFRSCNEDAYYGPLAFKAQVVGAHGAVGRFPRLPDRGLSVYESVSDAFEWLPLGAVVQGTVLVLHGGIGSQGRRATVSQRHSFNQAAAPEPGPRWGVADLAAVQRPIRELAHADPATGKLVRGSPGYPQLPRCVAEALWSDPTHSDADAHKGVHGSPRGGGVTEFGPDVTAEFCEREGLQLIVRSHEFVACGIKFMHSGRLATVFSARNYTGVEDNDAALLLFAFDEGGNLRCRAKRLNHRVARGSTGPSPRGSGVAAGYGFGNSFDYGRSTSSSSGGGASSPGGNSYVLGSSRGLTSARSVESRLASLSVQAPSPASSHSAAGSSSHNSMAPPPPRAVHTYKRSPTPPASPSKGASSGARSPLLDRSRDGSAERSRDASPPRITRTSGQYPSTPPLKFR